METNPYVTRSNYFVLGAHGTIPVGVWTMAHAAVARCVLTVGIQLGLVGRDTKGLFCWGEGYV